MIDVEPLLRVIVARVVLALADAEHLELALVPADHEVDAETAFADVVDGDEFLRGDHRIEQRRVHGAEHRDAPVAASRPAAQVTVSSVAPWKSVSPP